MKRTIIYLLALATFSMIFYASCRKNHETTDMEELSSNYELPGHPMGVFYFDGSDGLIGYKTEDSANVVTNFDSSEFTFYEKDTLFTCNSFRIHHDMNYPNIAYLMFKGTAEYTNEKGEKIQILGNFALELNYVADGTTAAPPKKFKETHKCESYNGLLDALLMCDCCEMVWKEGVITGCKCTCGWWGVCLHTKTLEEVNMGWGQVLGFTGSVYNRIIEK